MELDLFLFNENNQWTNVELCKNCTELFKQKLQLVKMVGDLQEKLLNPIPSSTFISGLA